MTEEFEWGKLAGLVLGSSLLGTVLVKAADVAYQELTRRRAQKKTTEQFVDQHVYPFLKTTDELVGKLHTLAQKDFKPIQGITPDERSLDNSDFASLTYLFGMFWARVEKMRHEGLSVSMAADKRGQQLQSFFDCLESPKVRLFETIQQRAIGETLVVGKETRSFTDFVATFEKDATLRRWTFPLVKLLSRLKHTTERQLVLQYAIVLHVMMDTLDPQHRITSDRPSLELKLNAQTWANLNYLVFGKYLQFVDEPSKYIGPPKARAAQDSKGKAAL